MTLRRRRTACLQHTGVRRRSTGSAVEWIYGRNVVQLALAAGARRRAHRLAATPPALKALRPAIPLGLTVETADTHVLDELTGSRDHQGVALQVDAFAYATADELLGAEIAVSYPTLT